MKLKHDRIDYDKSGETATGKRQQQQQQNKDIKKKNKAKKTRHDSPVLFP